MACFRPLPANYSNIINVSGKRGIVFTADNRGEYELLLPCGKCVGCLLERSRQWAIRCRDEASIHQDNCFITLTYNNHHNPGTLKKEHWQTFMKRLRKSLGPDQKILYYHAGEYGSKFMRPHYHALLFNYNFSDRYPYKRNGRGDWYYRSATLERLWPFGYSTIGECTWETAAYTARYCLKKYRGKKAKAEQWYNGRLPEYATMSLKPAIGYSWIKKNLTDVYNYDMCLVNGRRCKPPRYYDKILERSDSEWFKKIKTQRLDAVKDDQPERDRLLVSEAIQKKTLEILERRYEVEEQ